jgi:hypothetical protein
MTTAVEQIATAPAHRDVAWLREALQSAIALEHSTLPLYTASMLSLEVQNYTTYNVIRSVLMEEMVHMAIAANMLSALGGTPRIRDLDPGYPRFGLPGGVEPDLQVGLAKLSKRQLANFMRLEAPFFLLAPEHTTESYPTIGRLYLAIKDAINGNADEVRAAFAAGGPANQVGDNIGFNTFSPDLPMDPIEQLNRGIDEILEQGEGSLAGQLTAGPEFQNEESHYGRFAELYYGATYHDPGGTPLTRETEPLFFAGAEIPWPEVINTLAVPSDGYERIIALDPDSSAVASEMAAFDGIYRSMLDALQKMWVGPADLIWPTFGQAVEAMMKLRVFSSFTFMRREIPRLLIDRLPELYPEEFGFLVRYTDLAEPVFYGPRFRLG